MDIERKRDEEGVREGYIYGDSDREIQKQEEVSLYRVKNRLIVGESLEKQRKEECATFVVDEMNSIVSYQLLFALRMPYPTLMSTYSISMTISLFLS